MTVSLKSRTIHGVFWSSVDTFGRQAIQFVISIIIARILMPADYGLIGMLTIFFGIAQSFVDSGFGVALIQKKNPTQTDYSTVFFFNIAVGLLFYTILFFSAPLIADFYKQPMLLNLTRVLGLSVIINSFSIVQANIFAKKIDFKTTAKISLITVLFSGTTGLFMAFHGFGVWSLAIQQIVALALNSILLWFFSKWKPDFIFSLTSLKTMFKFGSRLLASGLLEVLFTNVYNLVIGKVFSADKLGYYTQAQKIQTLPSNLIRSTISRVTFPVFSSIQDDDQRLKQGYRKTIKIIIFIVFPLMIGIMVVAESLIKVLLTDKWLPSVAFLQLLCIIGMTYPLSSINLNILKVKGRSDIFFRLEVIKKILIAISIAISLPFGIMALIIGRVILSFISFVLNIYYSGKLIDFSIKEQLSDIFPYFVLSLCMGIIIYLFGFLFDDNDILKLVFQVVLGAAVYIVGSYLYKFEAMQEALEIINKLKKRLNF
ncbi:MAG: MOP flippase family protein [Bacteroidales bacterium]|nr:MOP flippase family protein [Bacteroidales bacterium]